MLEEDDELLKNVDEITIFPPVNTSGGNITNEDSGDGENFQIDNLPVSPLRTPAEIKIRVSEKNDVTCYL